MVEYWAVIGLACIDHDFLEALQGDVERATNENNFRLSRYEKADIERLLLLEDVVEAMKEIGRRGWSRACSTGKTPNGTYDHREYSPEDLPGIDEWWETHGFGE